MTDGKQLCALQGHKGRGVWRCLLHPDQDLLITAGADSSIKLWRLADWLPAHHPLAAQASDAFTLPPPPTPGIAPATAAEAVVGPAATADPDLSGIAPSIAAGSPLTSTPAVKGVPASAAADAAGRSVEDTEAASTTAATAGEKANSSETEPRQPAQHAKHKPKPAAAARGRDSKDEWVRCLKLADQRTLYLATNLGCLYRMKLPSNTTQPSPDWQLLYSSPRKAAIISMQIVYRDKQSAGQASHARSDQTQSLGGALGEESDLGSDCHWVVFGDIKGVITSFKVEHSSRHSCTPRPGVPAPLAGDVPPLPEPVTKDESSQAALEPNDNRNSAPTCSQGARQQSQAPSACVSWDANQGKPVLAVFTAPAFGPRHVFTTSINGTPLRWWLMPQHASSSDSPGAVAAACGARLLAEIRVPSGRGCQIAALDACPKRGLLVCGDMAGNVMGFAVPSGTLKAHVTGLSQVYDLCAVLQIAVRNELALLLSGPCA